MFSRIRAALRRFSHSFPFAVAPGRFFIPAALALLLFAQLLPNAAAASEETASTRGRASWYGTTAHGKPTANGEIYNRQALTAAHKELPFGTVLRVHNLKNGRHTLVRVNDRGPYVKSRVLDVSRRAAELLRMTRAGVVSVIFEVVSNRWGESLTPGNAFFVHIATEHSSIQASAAASRLEKEVGRPVKALFSLEGNSPTYALCLGPYPDFEEAHKDFVTFEERQIALLGIVEAPADGSDIPPRIPPGLAKAPKKDLWQMAKEARGESPAPFWLDPERRALLLAVMRTAVPGLTGNSAFFRLPEARIFDYLTPPS